MSGRSATANLVRGLGVDESPATRWTWRCWRAGWRIVSHRLGLDEAPQGYEMFKHKQDNCTKVVLQP